MTSELPAGWVRAPLRDLCEIASGATPKTGVDRYWSEDVVWITPDDMAKDRSQVIRRGRRGLSHEGYDSCSARLIPAGSVIFSSRAPIGYVAIAGTELCTNQGCKSALPSPALDPNYLYWYLQYVTPEIQNRASGTTFKEISAKGFGDTQVLLPPLAEQVRIAAVLDAQLTRLDIATSNIEAAGRRDRTLVASLAAQAVSGRLMEFSGSGDSGDALLKDVLAERKTVVARRRANPSGPGATFPVELPKHWAVASVDQLTSAIEYGTSAKTAEMRDASDIPVLRMGNLQSGVIDPGNLKFLPSDHDDVKKLMLEDGDLLFNRTNSAELVGKSAVYHGKLGPMTFASYLIRCQFLAGIEPEWVNLVINSPYGRKYVASVASQQVGQANVNGTKLAAMPIPLPPTAEQKEILAELALQQDRLARVRVLTNAAASRRLALRRAIMEAAFSGKLVPQDANDEPASALLEKIKSASFGSPRRRSRRISDQSSSTPSTYVKEELPL
ncbi:restriction endonuclease subunit S [Kitasatospora sp. NPDC004272]